MKRAHFDRLMRRPSGNGSHHARFVALDHLRKRRGSEQVAAVCYRVRNGAVEFLLVRTRNGRWIFPKGSAEPGLTHAQAAALEAFEEAGVHGKMELSSFARYVRRKGSSAADSIGQVTTTAFLCEVLWLDAPQELDRNPTWFSAEKAKKRLREDRPSEYGRELARIVDCAASRIRQTHRGSSTVVDALQKVQFIDSSPRHLLAGRVIRPA